MDSWRSEQHGDPAPPKVVLALFSRRATGKLHQGAAAGSNWRTRSRAKIIRSLRELLSIGSGCTISDAVSFARRATSASLGKGQQHPELLDYLACRVRGQRLVVSKMHRTIMLSARTSERRRWSRKNLAAIRENRLLWRYNRQRLDAEALRDSMLLFVAGKLDLQKSWPCRDIRQR